MFSILHKPPQISDCLRLGTFLALLVTLTACDNREMSQQVLAKGTEKFEKMVTHSADMPNPSISVEPHDLSDREFINKGKRLYTWFNCVGCHADSGGGLGPPLIDEEWIYGSESIHIYSSIVDGRSNGMPAFGDKISESEVWALVAYVRALGGLGNHLPEGEDNQAFQDQASSNPNEGRY